MALFVHFNRLVQCWEKAIFETSEIKPVSPATHATVSIQTSKDIPGNVKSVLAIPDAQIPEFQCVTCSLPTLILNAIPPTIASGDAESESNTRPDTLTPDTETEKQPCQSCSDGEVLKLRLTELTEENRELISQRHGSNLLFARIQREVRGRTLALHDSQKRNVDLQQELLKLTELKASLENKLREKEEHHRRELHQQQAVKEAEIKEIHNRLDLEHKAQLHSELTKTQVQHGIHQTRIFDLEAEVFHLQRSVTSYQDQLDLTTTQLDECQLNFSKLQQANCHLNDFLQQQQTACAEAFRELAECDETIEKMRVFHAIRMEAKEEQIQQLHLQLKEVTEERNASAEVSPNYYKLLGVTRQTPGKEIKKAYYAKALEHHPDRVSDPDDRKKSEARFQLIKYAYEMLSHPKLKIVYDEWFDQKVIISSYQRVYCD